MKCCTLKLVSNICLAKITLEMRQIIENIFQYKIVYLGRKSIPSYYRLFFGLFKFDLPNHVRVNKLIEGSDLYRHQFPNLKFLKTL